MTKHPRKVNQGRKDLFWLMISEISAHGLLDSDKVEVVSSRVWQNKTAHLRVVREQRKEGKGLETTQGSPPHNMSSVTQFLQLNPTSCFP